VDLKTRLLQILEEEEEEGDNNTKYFYRVANGRKHKQMIYSLKNGNNIIQGHEELLNLASDYYKNCFGPGVGNVFEIDPNLWQGDENVNTMENEHLTKPFFLESEIRHALFQMERNKVVGPDGLPIIFFRLIRRSLKGIWWIFLMISIWVF
jgi:hypothetical protein